MLLLPRIETERLLLRTYQPEDLETVYLLCSDPDVAEFFPDYYSINKEHVLASLPRRIERWRKFGFGQLGVFEKTSEELIGYCGMQYLDDTTEVELYYGFFKKYWKRGYATEAAKAILKFGFEQIKLERIVAVTNPKNIPSQKVLLRLGMKKGGERKFYKVDAAYFSMRRVDYQPENDFYNLSFISVNEEIDD